MLGCGATYFGAMLEGHMQKVLPDPCFIFLFLSSPEVLKFDRASFAKVLEFLSCVARNASFVALSATALDANFTLEGLKRLRRRSFSRII